MKISDLLTEMPTDLTKDAPFVFTIDGSYISNRSLIRDFNFLGELTIDQICYKFWMTKKVNRALITTDSTEKSTFTVDNIGDQKNTIVCDLTFKPQTLIDLPNSVQIDTVSTNSKYSGRNMAMILYVVIARYGYPVVSDFEQYTGGVELWKTIARHSGPRNFSVKIWNIPNSDWLRDNSGQILSYDSKNIPTNKVWNNIGQSTETLLVLTQK